MAGVLVSMIAVQVMVALASLVVPVLMPAIGADTGLPAAYAGYFAGATFLSAALSGLGAPILIARHGAFRVSQGTLALAAAGAAALAVLPAPAMLVGAVLIGLAYGPNNPASSHLLARIVPPRLRGRVFSLKQTSVPIAGVAAGTLLPPLGEALGWRGAAALVAAASVAVAVAIQPLRRDLDADRVPGRTASAGEILEPLRLLVRDRALGTLALGSVGFGALQFAFTSVFVSLLVLQADLSPADAGRALAVATGLSIAARPLSGWFADRFGPRRAFAVLGSTMGLAALAATWITPAWPGWLLIALSGVLGAAALGWNGVYLSEVARTSGPGRVAQATSGAMFATYAGALAGPLCIAALSGVTGSLAHGFALLGVLAAAAGWMLARTVRGAR